MNVNRETHWFRVDAMRCWNSETTSILVKGSYLGALIVTPERLIFSSSGGSGLSSRLKAAAVRGAIDGLPHVFVRSGQKVTKDLEMDNPKMEGSFDVSLHQVLTCEAARRWDFSSFLKLSLETENGVKIHKALMTEGGIDKQEITTIASVILKAKAIHRNQGT